MSHINFKLPLTLEALISKIEAARGGRLNWMISRASGSYAAVIEDDVIRVVGNGAFRWGCIDQPTAIAALTAAAKEAGIIP